MVDCSLLDRREEPGRLDDEGFSSGDLGGGMPFSPGSSLPVTVACRCYSRMTVVAIAMNIAETWHLIREVCCLLMGVDVGVVQNGTVMTS